MKNLQFVDISGFGVSGKGAFLSLLSEFRGYHLIDYNFEFPKNIEKDLSGLKIGIISEYFQKTTDPKVYLKIIEELKFLGAKIEEVELKWADLALAVYYILQPAELSTNLSRFDGIRYGKQIEKDDLNDLYKATRGAGFGAEIKRRLILGSFVLSASYYDAYYKKAQKVRDLIKNEYEELFEINWFIDNIYINQDTEDFEGASWNE